MGLDALSLRQLGVFAAVWMDVDARQLRLLQSRPGPMGQCRWAHRMAAGQYLARKLAHAGDRGKEGPRKVRAKLDRKRLEAGGWSPDARSAPAFQWQDCGEQRSSRHAFAHDPIAASEECCGGFRVLLDSHCREFPDPSNGRASRRAATAGKDDEPPGECNEFAAASDDERDACCPADASSSRAQLCFSAFQLRAAGLLGVQRRKLQLQRAARFRATAPFGSRAGCSCSSGGSLALSGRIESAFAEVVSSAAGYFAGIRISIRRSAPSGN